VRPEVLLHGHIARAVPLHILMLKKYHCSIFVYLLARIKLLSYGFVWTLCNTGSHMLLSM